MALSFFDNKSHIPNEQELQACIGDLQDYYWNQVESEIEKIWPDKNGMGVLLKEIRMV